MNTVTALLNMLLFMALCAVAVSLVRIYRVVVP